MKHTITNLAVAATMLAAVPCSAQQDTMQRVNPFLQDYTTVYQIPPFDQIRYSDYLPALRSGIEQHNAEIDYICFLSETPTFENTILALEKSGRTLDKVVLVFSALEESNSSPEMIAIAEELYPLYSQHSDAISMNNALFKRIKYLYDNRETLGLDVDQKRLIEQYYKDFVRNGALLKTAQKKELTELNTQLTSLYLKFNKNLLAATNAFQIVVDDPARLAGLPANVVAVAAEETAARGLGDGKWVFTLHAPSRLPVLQYAADRDLRRQMYEGYTSLAQSGEYNNLPVISDILNVRARKAALLGYKDFGSYMTDNVMAKSVDNARNLLMQIWKPAVERVNSEVAEMQAYADRSGDKITIEPWDYYYYAEKLRLDKYNIDENEVRAYFPLDGVRKGIFTLAERLYGVRFTEIKDAPKYFDEVTVYDVTDAKTGEHIAVFMTDYFTRASKRQGAWMSEFKGSWTDDDGTSSRPIIFNVGNFTRPAGEMPALLSLDEVATTFHEFGHGLHGMLTRARYKSQAGTNVDRDFVELPSQINEHWALEPELLKEYARHYRTGAVIPDELIGRLAAASTHNQGFMTAELCGAALLDLEFGQLNPDGPVDVAAFERQVTDKLGMPSQLTYRYRPAYFKHVFGSDGYASGYYTYLWAEVLDTDAFELFKERGVFDPATAASFKKNILEAGGSEDPMQLFVRFRGHEPSVGALLRNRGLAQ